MYNFIIICIDCLRYDRISDLRLTPFLAGLVEEFGFSFENTYTSAPWTYPATNSILTGLYPHNHGAFQEGIYRQGVKDPWPLALSSDIPTLFSDLKRYGYFNLGISTLYWALNEKCQYSGVDRIIRSEEQDVFYKNVKSEWVIDSFMEVYSHQIKNNRFFAFLHLCDLHRPYDLDIASQYAKEPIEIMKGIEDWDIRPYLNNPHEASRFKKNKLKLYDALISYIDFQLKRLVEFLMDKNIFDNTIIIITADHGEEFWDHLEFEQQNYSCGRKSEEYWLMGTGHGHTLFNEIIHVPLIFINPYLKGFANYLTYPASTIDIFPTIMNIAGIEGSQNRVIDGISLFENPIKRELLAESILYGFERKAIINGNMKFIYSPYENHFVAFDLSKDPFELNALTDPLNNKIKSNLDKLYSANISRGDPLMVKEG